MSDQAILCAEYKWEKNIIQYISKLYVGQWLPSHDLNHHHRVWKNACELSAAIYKKHPVQDIHFFEKLLLACYFHDIGLLEDRGENHGKLSRKFCEDFLTQNIESITFDSRDLLEAIEFHDDKNYANVSRKISNNIYNLLSMADDLDALGAVGAYRYIEIYLLRGVSIIEMSEQILNNVIRRYDYFNERMNGYDFNSAKYQLKYNTIISLFEDNAFFEKPVSLIWWINDKISNTESIQFSLDINGRKVQDGNTANMLFKFDHIIEYISQFVTLKMGDLIYTGTPVGVGPVKINDHLEGFIEEKKLFDFMVK